MSEHTSPVMKIPFVDPYDGSNLERGQADYRNTINGHRYPIVAEVPRFCPATNYTESFGYQWEKFSKTQLDTFSMCSQSRERLLATTSWKNCELIGKDIIEVGSGAGRFTQILLSEYRESSVYSIDYSRSIEVNWLQNKDISNRFAVAQASVYNLPFPPLSFDKVLCLGMLQHTPSVEKTISCLVAVCRPGGEIVVDFYQRKHLLTKLHAKYLLRPLTRRIKPSTLIKIIEFNINWLMIFFDFLVKIKLGVATRFLPIADLRNFPKKLSVHNRREWAILDTFDAFSPRHDNPQNIETIVKLFEKNGCHITFSGEVDYSGVRSTVVRALKPSHVI